MKRMLSKVLTAAKIKEIRENAGYTREEIAELMNVSSGTVVNWETEKEDGNPKSTMSMTEFERYMTVTATNAEDVKSRRKIFNSLENLISRVLKA
jgi:DNA-binding XRE family transcriptional regulator